MTNLLPEQIEEFQKIYKNHFGTEISKSEAERAGVWLVDLIKAVFVPPQKEQKTTSRPSD